MAHDVLQETKSRMNAQIDHLKEELKGLRAGRATAALIEPVTVEVYGSQMKLKELGTITSPESRQLVINPFDPVNAGPIAKAIDKANLGLRTVVEGKTIRVLFPELTQDRRKELIGQCHKKREESKVAVRNIRRDQNEVLKKKKADGHIPEDDVKRMEKEIQTATDNACRMIDDVCAAKEKEISTI